jgi:hypothetical protein
MNNKILGYDWLHIERVQQGGGSSLGAIDVTSPGDYGSDPIGNGMFRMVPSGDVVDLDERNKRMAVRAALKATGAAIPEEGE